MVLKREFLVNRYFIYIALPPHYLFIFWLSLSDGKIQITILIPRRGALPKCICNKFRLLGKDSCVVVLLLIKLSIQKFWDYGIQVCKRVNMTNLGLQIILTWFRIFVEYIFVSCVFFGRGLVSRPVILGETSNLHVFSAATGRIIRSVFHINLTFGATHYGISRQKTFVFQPHVPIEINQTFETLRHLPLIREIFNKRSELRI